MVLDGDLFGDLHSYGSADHERLSRIEFMDSCGLLIAIELLLQGWSLLFMGLAARSLTK